MFFNTHLTPIIVGTKLPPTFRSFFKTGTGLHSDRSRDTCGDHRAKPVCSLVSSFHGVVIFVSKPNRLDVFVRKQIFEMCPGLTNSTVAQPFSTAVAGGRHRRIEMQKKQKLMDLFCLLIRLTHLRIFFYQALLNFDICHQLLLMCYCEND